MSLDDAQMSGNEPNEGQVEVGQTVAHAPSATVNTYPQQDTQQGGYVQPNNSQPYETPINNSDNTVETGGNDYERKQY